MSKKTIPSIQETHMYIMNKMIDLLIYVLNFLDNYKSFTATKKTYENFTPEYLSKETYFVFWLLSIFSEVKTMKCIFQIYTETSDPTVDAVFTLDLLSKIKIIYALIFQKGKVVGNDTSQNTFDLEFVINALTLS